MKRIQHRSIGAPADVLEVIEEPSGSPKAGEVRIKVLATPIHPSNLLQIAGLYGVRPELPATPGSEGVGEVVELGDDVEHLSTGQKVLLAGVGGTWRTELIAPAAALFPLPDADVEQLSMAMINPLTAWLMLTSFAKLNEGDWVVQSAANSAVGECLIQLASSMGLRTINVVRREELVPQLKTLGATVVVTDGPDLAERIQESTDGAPVRLAIDAVAGDTFSALLESLGQGGAAVSYGAMSMAPSTFNPGTMIFRELKIHGFWLSKWFQNVSSEVRNQALGEIVSRVARGDISMTVDARFPLSEIKDAVTRAGESGRSGKVLLVPSHE